MNDVIFWLGFTFGVCAVLLLIAVSIFGYLLYDKIKERIGNAV